jgi:hypothetical protein
MADLVVLVADVQQEATLTVLLQERYQALGIRPITTEIYRHPRKDSGVCHEAAEFLATFQPPTYQHALVVLDCAWEGRPGDAAYLQSTIVQSLQASGWPADDCAVVAIDPELENWVWSRSSHVPEVLRTTWDDIRALGQQLNCWQQGQLKPHDPKRLLEGVLRRQRRPRSSAIFQELARRISLAGCQDPSFVLMYDTLRRWFGQPT